MHTMNIVVLIFFVNILVTNSENIPGPASTLTIERPPKSSGISKLFDETARFAVNDLNEKMKRETQQDDYYELQDLKMERARIADAVAYDLTLQFDARPELIQFQFVEPTSQPNFGWIQHSLPTSSLGNELMPQDPHEMLIRSFTSPRFKEMVLQGPMHLAFTYPRDDLHFRLPNLVELNNVRKIRILPNVELTANGITSFRLLEPVEIELKTHSTEKLGVILKHAPRLEIAGSSLSFYSEKRAKVRRISNFEIEITNATTSNVSPLKNIFIEIPKESPLMKYIEYMLTQSALKLSSGPSMNARRLVDGCVEAVTLFLVPMEVRETMTGQTSELDVMVVQDAKGNRRIVSIDHIQKNQITVSPSMLYNSTIDDMVVSLQELLSQDPQSVAQLGP